MTRSRRGVYAPISQEISGMEPTPRTLDAVLPARVCRSNADGDGVNPPASVVSVSTFYSDASTQELHSELVRLSQVLQARGEVIA